MRVPSPPVPRKIRSASEAAQMRTTSKTWDRERPCLITKAFWAPMAIMSERPVKKPGRSAITLEKYLIVCVLELNYQPVQF
jgi:hypothetical protein